MSTNYQAIPQADPLSNYIAHQKEIDQAIHASLESGKYIRGPQTKAFEQEFAEYLGEENVVGVDRGTDAIAIALRALEVESGHVVVTVSYTAVATVAALEMVGEKPMLVDVEEKSQVICQESFARMDEQAERVITAIRAFFGGIR